MPDYFNTQCRLDMNIHVLLFTAFKRPVCLSLNTGNLPLETDCHGKPKNKASWTALKLAFPPLFFYPPHLLHFLYLSLSHLCQHLTIIRYK